MRHRSSAQISGLAGITLAALAMVVTGWLSAPRPPMLSSVALISTQSFPSFLLQWCLLMFRSWCFRSRSAWFSSVPFADVHQR
jgi:hypothetical protein